MRTVEAGDAIAWLQTRGVIANASFVTSLPDVSELGGVPFLEWKAWFSHAAAMVLRACPDDGVTIFFQSDIKHGGEWVDKGYLVSRAAENEGVALLWHKIVCRKAPGTITHGRAAYSHMLCFSRGVRPPLSHATADVLDGGEKVWSKGMGRDACIAACRFVQKHTASKVIVDPFCGRGTTLAVADALGFDSIGVDLSRRQCRHAERLQFEL